MRRSQGPSFSSNLQSPPIATPYSHLPKWVRCLRLARPFSVPVALYSLSRLRLKVGAPPPGRGVGVGGWVRPEKIVVKTNQPKKGSKKRSQGILPTPGGGEYPSAPFLPRTLCLLIFLILIFFWSPGGSSPPPGWVPLGF